MECHHKFTACDFLRGIQGQLQVPRIESHSRAAKLLERADELLRPTQHESSTKKKLKSVLLLRCKLPTEYHGDTIPEALLHLKY